MGENWTAAGIGVLVTMVAGAIIKLLTARKKAKSDEIKDAISYWRVVVVDLREQVERHAEQLEQDQRLIDALFEDNGDCHSQQQLQYAWMKQSAEWCQEAVEALKELGKNLGDPPKLGKPPKARMSRDRAEFQVRTSKQSASLLKEADSKILPPPELKP